MSKGTGVIFLPPFFYGKELKSVRIGLFCEVKNLYVQKIKQNVNKYKHR